MSSLMLVLGGVICGSPPEPDSRVPPQLVVISPDKDEYISGEPVRVTVSLSNPFARNSIVVAVDESHHGRYGTNCLGLVSLKKPLALIDEPIHRRLVGSMDGVTIKPGQSREYRVILQSHVKGLTPGVYAIDYKYSLSYDVVGSTSGRVISEQTAVHCGTLRFLISPGSSKTLGRLIDDLYEKVQKTGSRYTDSDFDALASIVDARVTPLLVKSMTRACACNSDQYLVAMRRLATDRTFSNCVAEALDSDDDDGVSMLLTNLGLVKYDLPARSIANLKRRDGKPIREALEQYFK